MDPSLNVLVSDDTLEVWKYFLSASIFHDFLFLNELCLLPYIVYMIHYSFAFAKYLSCIVECLVDFAPLDISSSSHY
jgi:hypothetical protein